MSGNELIEGIYHADERTTDLFILRPVALKRALWGALSAPTLVISLLISEPRLRRYLFFRLSSYPFSGNSTAKE